MKFPVGSVRLSRGLLFGGAAISAVLSATPAYAQSAAGVDAEYTDYSQTRIRINPPVFDIKNFDIDNFIKNPDVPALLPSVSVDGLAQCNQQLDGPAMTLDLAGAGFELGGLLVESVGALGLFPVEAAAVLVQAGGFFTHTASLGVQAYQTFGPLPECNAEILGGLKIMEGGISATGNSTIGGALGVGDYLSVGGSITAGGAIESASLDASGAVSAYGDRITLGTIDRTGVQPGISIGGGAIAGAGHLGPESFSLHATSIAIGNLSYATSEGSVAYGTNAVSDGLGTVAVGYNSSATAAQAIAVGNMAQALGTNSIAIGNQAKASNGAAVAIGLLNVASGNGAVAIGDPNVATGRGAVAIGADNTATGTAAMAFGADSVATGNGAQASGLAAIANGVSAIASGNGASATGAGALAIGQGAVASVANAIAVGTGSNAGFAGSVAIGQGARAGATNAVAMGNGANAAFADSVAIGAGATTQRAGQVAIGSANTVITLPSLSSAASRQAQTGPLSLVTTDMGGNLSSDGGRLAASNLINRQGVALGVAMQNPDLTGDENSGIAFNWGEFEGAEAYSASGAVVVARNIFGDGKSGRIALTGSIGISGAVTDRTFRLRVKESVATRIGGQITW